MISCAAWRLYVILDRAAAGARDLPDLAAAAIRGGADVLQLRDKRASGRQQLDTARRLLALTRPAGIPLIINDRPDIAKAAGADGVHLGQDDLPLPAARDLLGPACCIGQSTHSLEQALAAERDGADYIGIGPVFATPTKPDYGRIGLRVVEAVGQRVRVPAVCIGGIDAATLPEVLAAGGQRIAVVRAVCAAPDPEAAVRQLKTALTQFVPTGGPLRYNT